MTTCCQNRTSSLSEVVSSQSTALPPDEFVCPLTMEVMEIPMMTIWGHNFERDALLQWLQKSSTCPLTRNPITIHDVVMNRPLQAQIQYWKHQHSKSVHYDPDSLEKEMEFFSKLQSEMEELDTLRKKMILLREEEASTMKGKENKQVTWWELCQ